MLPMGTKICHLLTSHQHKRQQWQLKFANLHSRKKVRERGKKIDLRLKIGKEWGENGKEVNFTLCLPQRQALSSLERNVIEISLMHHHHEIEMRSGVSENLWKVWEWRHFAMYKKLILKLQLNPSICFPSAIFHHRKCIKARLRKNCSNLFSFLSIFFSIFCATPLFRSYLFSMARNSHCDIKCNINNNNNGTSSSSSSKWMEN